MKKSISFVLVFILLIVGTGGILAAPLDTYTDRECVNSECLVILYSAPTNVFEDGEWRNYKEARSLKDKEGFGIEFLEVDKDYPLEIVDFNASSITVDLKKWTILNKDIPLKIWEPTKDSLISDFKNTYNNVLNKNEKFTILDLGSKERTYNFKYGDVLEFGPESTTLRMNLTYVSDDSNIKENVPDTNYGSAQTMYVGKNVGNGRDSMIKWNISILKNTIVESSILTLWLENIGSGDEFNVDVFDMTNDWFEGNITWNNAPSPIGGYVDRVFLDQGEGDSDTHINWTVSSIIIADVNADRLSSSIYLNSPDAGYSEDGYFNTKEEDVAGERPVLYVTYNSQITPTITFPEDGENYAYLPVFLNWSLFNSGSLDMCTYSLNGASNVTVTCNDNYASVSFIEGSNTLEFYTNLTSGTKNSTEITFDADIPLPSVDIVYPISWTYGDDVTAINYNYITDYPSYCWWSDDGGASNSTLQACGTNWTGIASGDASYTWTVFINSTSVNNEESQDSVTFIVDTTAPALNITYPLTYVNYQRYYNNLLVTYDHSDDNPSMCWYDYTAGNTTITCGDGYIAINITDADDRELIMYANDTVPVEVQDSTSWIYKFLETDLEYNQTTYETAIEKYTVSLTSTGGEVVTATFNYNGTEYVATKTGNDVTMVFTSTLPSISEGYTGNNSFFWNLSFGEEYISSQTYYQQVSDLNFQQCNSTGYPFLNFTFKDEESFEFMSSKFSTSDLEYWLGDGTQKIDFNFIDNTANPSYGFCLNVNYTLNYDGEFRYSNTSYPQRIFTTSGTLTNDTTFELLYLLHEDDGIFSSIQVVDGLGDVISGVEVTAEREFSGTWTTVGISNTDSAGSVTFWVNPDYDHRFTFSKSGCTGVTSTLRPTQTQYTQTLDCGANTSIYISPLQGIIYSRKPAEGILLPGVTNFTFQVVSSRNNIQNASMEIIFANGTVINSTWDSCSPSGCTMFVTYTTYEGMNLKGRYYVDIGNGSIMLEGDSAWYLMDTGPGGSSGGLLSAFMDFQRAINGWSSSDQTSDYNRLIIAFFIMALIICVMNVFTGMDSVSPGLFLIFMTAFVFIGSIADGALGQGFFYYNNLTGFSFLNNYILFLMLLALTIAQFVNIARQAQR